MSSFDRLLSPVLFLAGLGESIYLIYADGISVFQFTMCLFLLAAFFIIHRALRKGNITVHGGRNLYGLQRDSFQTTITKADNPRRFYMTIGLLTFFFLFLMSGAFAVHIYHQQRLGWVDRAQTKLIESSR